MMNPRYINIQKKISYVFKDESLLVLALTHRSYGSDNNERLEFLGDALLNSAIAQALFFKFPEEKEGVLSRLRSQLVKGETLSEIARTFELGDYLIMGAGEMKSGGYLRDSILADVVEAIIGAIYLDAGLDSAQTFINAIYATRLEELSVNKHLKDPKTRLQECLQARQLPLPSYDIVDIEGESHKQQFSVRCKTNLLEHAPIAIASSRRQAEQLAAEKVLQAIEKKHHE